MHYARPPHPPPDPPIPEASALGPETRHSLFMPHCLAQAELEHTKQRHSFPDRLVRSRSSDIVCPGRRPTSDPGLNRRVAVEERDPAGAFALGPSSSPSKDSLKGEVRGRRGAFGRSGTAPKRAGSCASRLTRLICIFTLATSICRLRTGKTATTRSPIATGRGGRNVSCRPFPKVRLVGHFKHALFSEVKKKKKPPKKTTFRRF